MRASSEASGERERGLVDWFREAGPVLLGFSGGVDSSYLAAVAVEALGASRVLAVLGVSASLADEQRAVARDVATRVGVPLVEVPTFELDDPAYAANPTDRCYFCKRELWGRLAPLGRERGMVIVDGTNADDLADWRPGGRAAEQAGVRSPLAELGFTKAEIRARSAARGLPTAELPAAPCLASRLPYGTAVTTDRLAMVGRAESALRGVGIGGDLRVRHHGELARVELGPEELARCADAARLREIRAAVRGAGYARVAIDLRGFRSGSLNVLGGVVAA
ncbi:ATP-dependent sacrificial sulfur transferase LarE [Roseisolibacter sp. H3M3-2]|uniref:ATP-dependent sacrificial sulfur transferase LarE n=1 Tax=Roseisolibacter sp. H3M3-2 TaxID=3031323 RepID=UPI0023DB6DF9|nr:ATP-dependent sacrificial sulfur transferase LarE [Roseisolibacter sp. H3M3-2]MDF1504285.1 ATP-dependent sacrificial sulfur transferase LarE [Roseisolibacter sp. H3M3-2]